MLPLVASGVNVFFARAGANSAAECVRLRSSAFVYDGLQTPI